MENNKSELIKALVKFQSEVGAIKKDKDNPFFKSKYADLSSFLDACQPAMVKSGLAITQTMKITESGQVLITVLWHESGQCIESEYLLSPVKADPQSMGSAITYARRYSLSAILGVASEDDDDANQASEPVQQYQAPKPQNKNHQGSPQPRPQQKISYDHCPSCQAVAIGKSIQGGGYYCFPKQGGCGKAFPTKSGEAIERPPINGNGGDPKSILSLEDEFKTLCEIHPPERKMEFKELAGQINQAFTKLDIPKAEALMKGWRVRLSNQPEVSQ